MPFVARSVALIFLLAAACATPRLTIADPSTLLRGDLIFLSDGKTEREEVLLRLGEPTGRFEGDRIFTYPLSCDAKGEWHLGKPQATLAGTLRAGAPGSGSLVLVFRTDGVLARHSFVVPR